MSTDTQVPTTPRRRTPQILVAVAIAVAIGVGIYWYFEHNALVERQAEVAERGAAVMPFALEVTTHVFRPADDGGVQTVVADDAADDAQIELIRSHLREEAEQFRGGDFSDPAMIHGEHMPGLEALSDGADRIDITYSDMPDGGRITYVTDDPELVNALHDWFEAQLSDHGHDATRG